MSDISELSTQQKTELLARAAGWTIDGVIDLYDGHNMPQAWRVARWAAGQEYGAIAWEFTQWWAMESLHDLPPEEAQAKWLDEVLRMVVGSGLVRLEEAPA